MTERRGVWPDRGSEGQHFRNNPGEVVKQTLWTGGGGVYGLICLSKRFFWLDVENG